MFQHVFSFEVSNILHVLNLKRFSNAGLSGELDLKPEWFEKL